MRHVRRRGHWFRVTMIIESAIGLTAIAVVTTIAIVRPDPVERLAMAALAIIAAAAVVFSRMNWRHQTPTTATTAEYLALADDRCRRLQRGIRAGWAVLAAEALVFVPWVWRRSGTPPSFAEWSWSFLAAMLAAGTVVILLFDRWARRERRIVEALKEEMELVPR